MAGENPQTTLPPVPREPLIDSRGGMSAQWERWLQQIQRILSFAGGVAWGIINKAQSRLDDIETRTHAMLQSILGWSTGADAVQDKHISNANGKVWQDHVEITNGNPHGTDHDMLDGLDDDDHAQYLLLAGRAGQRAVTPLIFGTASNNTTFEEDGTATFNGNATVWKDVMFPMAPPKTTGAGNPTLVTYNGNLRGYSFAVGDAHDFDPQEMEHDSKVGSTATFHVHWLSRSNDGTDRAVKWELEYDIEPGTGAVPVTVTASVEVPIPAGSAVNTVQRTDVSTFTITAIARLVGARINRVASTGTAPSVDPVLRALHFHYEIDTVGSRQITSK